MGAEERSVQPAKGFVILTLSFRKEGRLWAGRCLELGTATDGRSLSQVHDELLELVRLHLNALEDVGERERFFAEHDIKFYSDDRLPTAVTATLPLDDESYIHPRRFPVGLGA